MRRVLLAAAAGALCVSGQQQSGTLQALFDKQVKDNANLYSASVMTTQKGEVMWSSTNAFGNRRTDVGKVDRMAIDSETRVGPLAELLVVAAALKITAISSRLTQQIASEDLPNNFVASYKGTPITYNMLMLHTSSLKDGSYASYRKTSNCASGCTESVKLFTDWMTNDIFTLTSSSGSKEVDQSLFYNEPPNQIVRHSYLNTALLAFIIQTKITSQPITLKGSRSDVGAFIFENILQPAGMGSTFYASIKGEIPKIENTFLSAIWNSVVYEYDSLGSQTGFLHPNYWADVHLFSNPPDMIRLATQMLGNPRTTCSGDTLCSVGQQMLAGPQNVNMPDTLQIQQGLGVRWYDPVKICSHTTGSSIFTKCPLAKEHKVWGYMTEGTETTVAGIMCTDAMGVSTVNKASCVAVTMAYKQSSTKPGNLQAFALAGAAFQTAFGETTVPVVVSSDNADDLYGLWVGLGVCLTIVFVVAASFLTEFLLQPTAPLGPGPATYRPSAPSQGIPAPDYNHGANY